MLTTLPLLTSCNRRLRQEGVTTQQGEKAVKTIERSLAKEGPRTRQQLRERLDSADVPTEGQALIHLLFLAVVRGVAVRGPMVGKDHAYVLVRDWLDPPRRSTARSALAELARRYLVGQRQLTTATCALGRAAAARRPRWPRRDRLEAGRARGRPVHLAKHPPAAEVPGPRLLGAFDPLLLGWTSRELILGPHTHLVTLNGIFRPFAMVKGRAVGTWRLNRGKVTVEPLGKCRRRPRRR